MTFPIFDLVDGTMIEVRSNNAKRWSSDCCQCVLVFEQDTLDRDFEIQVCDIHKLVGNPQIVATVLAHNRGFNEKLGNIVLIETQQNEISLDKRNERARILALGNPNIRADRNNKAAIEAQLRAKGR